LITLSESPTDEPLAVRQQEEERNEHHHGMEDQ
jgi:hypothetical protein